MYFLKILKIDPTREGQRSKFLPIFWTRNNVSTCHSDSAGPTWTKIATVKQIDPGNKPLVAFLQNLQIDPTPEGQSSKFDLIWTRNHVLACHSDSAGPMWTKIGTVKQLDHGNKPVAAFLKFSKNGPLPVGVKGQI